MKIFRRLLLAVLAVLLFSQIPFAYRRYKLGRLQANILLVNTSRHAAESNHDYAEYVGVAHVHSFLGGHSTGTFSDIISAAQANHLHFVIMTEHMEKEYDTAEMTLRGMHGGVLFVNGNEVREPNGDRVLLLPGSSPQAKLIAYPEEFKGWDQNGYDGVEVYNVFTNARQVNPILAFFDSLWSRRAYGDLLFATFYRRPTENLRKWDQALSKKRLAATAGNDAHANIGVSLNDAGGKTLVGLKLDPYETSFRLVRLHVLLPVKDTTSELRLDSNELIRAIKDGHCFIGFDLFGDTSGFRFGAGNASESRIQGDQVTLRTETRISVDVPVASRILILKDGATYKEASGLTHLELAVTEPGVYRTEVYLPQLGSPVGDQPWIISNPVYVTSGNQ
jgi:hypothetical protein